MKDFSVLISTFGFAFGVCLEANLTLGKTMQEKILEVLNIAFWPLFGEIDEVLEKLNNNYCHVVNDPYCIGSISFTATYILLMLYMVIGTILLINLLIAIFR